HALTLDTQRNADIAATDNGLVLVTGPGAETDLGGHGAVAPTQQGVDLSQADLTQVRQIVAVAGSWYVVEDKYSLVCVIGPAQKATVIAGGGPTTADGDSAGQPALNQPRGLPGS